MRTRVAVVAVVLAALAACGKESLPKLPVSAGGERSSAMAADAEAMWAPYPTRYRVEGDLPDLPDQAPAYRLERTDVEAAVAGTAQALGIDGEVRKRGDSWVVGDGRRELVVYGGPGLSWHVGSSSDCAVSSDGTESCVVTAEAVADAAAPDQPPAPLDEEALATARQVLDRLGVVGEPTVAGNTAVVRPLAHGLPTVGYEFGVAIGPEGDVVSAHGWLGRPEPLGDYPLVSVEEGVDRLRSGFAVGPRALTARVAPVPDAPDLPEVAVTGVRLGLHLVEDHLVPAFLFEVEGGEGPAIVAVVERLLADLSPTPDPEPHPEPAPPDGGSGCGVSGTSSSEDAGNEPLTVEVCGPSTAKVGEEVVFDVTATDPDAPIHEGQCDGTIAGFGDTPVAAVGCAPGCTEPSPREPGKVARQYRHTYEKPGTYTAHFSFHSGPCGPYESRGEGRHTVVVR